MLVRVLIAVASDADRKRLCRTTDGPDVLVLQSTEEPLLRHLSKVPTDLVVVSHERLTPPEEETLNTIRALPESPDVVLVTECDDAEANARWLAAGCLAVVHPGIADDVLAQTMAALCERRRSAFVLPPASDPSRPPGLADLRSSSPAMQRVVEIAYRVARTDTSILILGKTGVGKELLARAIHETGSRARQPFMAVNCGAITVSLIESELFGHVEGAFTGATKAHRGFFELAHGGTVFLDEIGEMPLALQVKLLRVLQERRIRPVGGERDIAIDVRVISATNRDPKTEIREQRLREDLYYRLGVLTLVIPPLRERRDDIPMLVQSYFHQLRRRLASQAVGIEHDATKALMRYDWPGNVRELQNVIERAVLLCDGPLITCRELPDEIAFPEVRSQATAMAGSSGADAKDAALSAIHEPAWLDLPLPRARREAVRSFEVEYLTQLLRRSGGKMGEAAEHAGITPRSLYDKLTEHGLRRKDFAG